MTEFIKKCQQMNRGVQLKDELDGYTFTIYRFLDKPLYEVGIIRGDCERSYIATDDTLEIYIRNAEFLILYGNNIDFDRKYLSS